VADERDELARPHGEVDVAQHVLWLAPAPGVEPLLQVGDFEAHRAVAPS
jgi:hypothetical protein